MNMEVFFILNTAFIAGMIAGYVMREIMITREETKP